MTLIFGIYANILLIFNLFIVSLKIKGLYLNVIFVYDSNSEKERFSLWNNLEQLNNNITNPWIFIVDLNTVMKASDKGEVFISLLRKLNSSPILCLKLD